MPIKMATREQIGTYAKTLPISAKPLFIGSIPIAASIILSNTGVEPAN